MSLYTFSPIKTHDELIKAVEFTHFGCYQLCKQAFGDFLPNAGNIGIFSHYDDEYEILLNLRKEMTEPTDNINQKYFRLHEPITVATKDDVPETTYTYLYVRKPDPYRHQVGDVDFYLPSKKYEQLKASLDRGEVIKGARIFPREDLDMIELYDPDLDVLGYVSTSGMTERVRIKQSTGFNQ